jgi:hypothetical protein
MNANVKNLVSEFNNSDLLKMFEIEVINNRTHETDYIIFNISIEKNTLYATHESLTTKQEKSKKIAFVKVVLDNCFSLDENLQSLYDECITAILDSEFFTLS